MKSVDKSFYDSKQWQKCRDLYAQSVNHLCEVCLEKGLCVPGVIVHHKIHLNADNVNDPSVTLNFDNLQLVCTACHNKIHMTKEKKRRWKYVDGVLVMNELEE